MADEMLYPINARQQEGIRHEYAVQALLETCGWTVERWGTQTLPKPMRHAIVRSGNPILRCLPDLIATRAARAELVECKSSTRDDTPNHAIETASLDALRALESIGFPIVIVWSDFTVNRPSRLSVVKSFTTRSDNGGTGLPFSLVRKDAQRRFDQAFR